MSDRNYPLKKQRLVLDVWYDPKEFDGTPPEKWDWTALVDDPASVVDARPPRDWFPVVHFNDPRAYDILTSLPYYAPRVLKGPDCGSVWGDMHDAGAPCPTPHVIVLGVDEHDLEVFRSYDLPYSADTDDNYGSGPVAWRWLEDGACLNREAGDNDDRRTLWRDARNEVK